MKIERLPKSIKIKNNTKKTNPTSRTQTRKHNLTSQKNY